MLLLKATITSFWMSAKASICNIDLTQQKRLQMEPFLYPPFEFFVEYNAASGNALWVKLS